MVTIRQLQLIANAGDPDDVLARRIDVVAAALAWHETAKMGYDNEADRERVDVAAAKLDRACRRYKRAIRQRKQGPR